ncbi:MAG: (2Fe-2S)-binding protein [Burkholderiales bacterium]|nr:(2Fe-2S)-binding protein [Burkholderiales bacterium]
MTKISFTINGKQVSTDVEGRTLLVDLIRDELRLTGTHVGCDTSQCGCCTIELNGDMVKSCAMLAAQADGATITTIEGLAKGDVLHPVQQAFTECHGLQCGFCTPGMIMASVGILKANPNPSDDDIVKGLEGNLCRCTGYVNIIKSVKRAAELMKA